LFFASGLVAAALCDFLQAHPQLKIDLNASDGALNLVEARIDLAIRISAEPDPALIGRVLAPCASVLVASPAYLAAQGTPKVPADLEAHRCLSFVNFGKSTWTLRRGEATCEVRVRSQLSANEATALLQAALAGGGVALQPTYLANPHLANGRLQAVLPAWKPPDMSIYALYPSRKHLSPAVRALLDFLVQRFSGQRW
jgi:DNA-binding transcriptional LysR family regulator